MPRLILAILLFLFSLLTVLPIPARQVWYPAIAVSEFPWVWMPGAAALIAWIIAKKRRRRIPALVFAVAALTLFSRPLFGAFAVGRDLDARLTAAFGISDYAFPEEHRNTPFSLAQMIGGIGAPAVAYRTYPYGSGGEEHTLRFYPAQGPGGKRPCIVVVHGGSWRSGSNAELPDVNSYYARAGYHVASINYRLAPGAKHPAPTEDVRAALLWLHSKADSLHIDTTAFVLMGRSAGCHIALHAAYTLQGLGIVGVAGYYGPTDMLFAYNDQHNKLVMDHQMVMRDFLGGPPDALRQQYIEASPVAHVSAGTVPTLLVHGGLDQHVHLVESELLAQKLQTAGVPHLLLALPWATHGCEYSLNGPSGQLATFATERFVYAVTHRR